ncbi:MAG: helix-turn-helix domain-containing protein [Alphaproteobacteria bacterium]|nr:helix-turn-helix domain-containing protein [Alphaproteobacteria bacterium]
MHFDYKTTFTLIEWLSITGVVQSTLILVYIIFRVRNWRQAFVALGYFLFLALSFALQFALRLEDFEAPIRLSLWFSRTMGPPLCYLLVLQVVRLTDLPDKKQFLILLTAPLAFLIAAGLSAGQGVCSREAFLCGKFFGLLSWTGAMSGALCMLAFFAHRHIFSRLSNVKGGRERYWLVITLIAANILLVFIGLLRSTDSMDVHSADALQVTLGMTFCYLATTTLFRVYPPPVQLSATSRTKVFLLSEEEKRIGKRVEKLMALDKVYHEQGFSRADLAREIGISESNLSKVINVTFGKSFPRLINEYRVEDAKRLLHDPDIAIQVLAFEVGFNSLASFNRVFRQITGQTPSGYRADYLAEKEERNM